MPLDPEDLIADAIRAGARWQSQADARNWNVPVVARQRKLETNPSAGDLSMEEIAPTFTVGWDGVGTTFYAFTPNVSVLDGSFMSADIVTGS